MFTGIIDATGKVVRVEREQNNVHYTIESPVSKELKIDQSVSHSGACLTVVQQTGDTHTVTAVAETLKRTNLGAWAPGTLINLERCLPMNGRLDGHIVQGHVDTVGTCVDIQEQGGSWRCTFRYEPTALHLLVDKGSVCINGISLTVVEPHDDLFSVAIIPYTWEHTNFHTLRAGDQVNLEFDVIGKYIGAYMERLKG